MKPPRLLCALLILLSIGAGVSWAETTNSTDVIPFKFQFERHRVSSVHSNYILRIYDSPKTNTVITVRCALLRDRKILGFFPLRLQRNEKDSYIWFNVNCLMNDLAEEGRFELSVTDLETDKIKGYMLPLKDAKQKH